MLSIGSPVATAIFWASFAGWMIAEYAVFVHGRRIDAPGEQRDMGSVWWVLAGAFGTVPVVLAVAVLLPAARIGSGWWIFGLGVALMWAGVTLRLWAVRTLGSYFQPLVTIQSEHRLVTEGPYGLVRHPSYTGALITLIGIGLSTGNVVALALSLALPIGGYLPRIRAEEDALVDGLGEQYVIYQQRSARLVPGVW